jgi:hypothetical protein
MDEVRRQLIILCRRARARQLGFPRDWRPGQVIDPRCGMPFTEPGAWDYVAEVLEGGHALEMLTLEVPAGATAYVLIVPQGTATPPIYIKVQLGSGCVIGRSFHYSHC